MIYLASPYTCHEGSAAARWGEKCKRVYVATEFECKMLHAGFVVYNPLRVGHGIWDQVPDDFEWLDYSCEFLERCDILLVLQQDGWSRSAGVQAEIALAKSLGIPVRYANPDGISHAALFRELQAILKGESYE